jgi:hypothetical protein
MSRATPFRFFPGRLSVVGSKYAEFEGGPWPEEAGVRLTVIAATDEGFITGIWNDSDQGELYSLSDDTGRDLLEQGGGSSDAGTSGDHKAAMFEVQGRIPPAPTASRITARGRILISTAPGTQPHKSAAIPAKEGARYSAATNRFSPTRKYMVVGCISFLTISSERWPP